MPDTVDFRDAMYLPALISVPRESDLAQFRAAKLPVLDQGADGACTGFALATVANYLLRVRGKDANADQVSAWMLYAMAKRYDEWPGEDYSGSSARGAMKGWYKQGLCAAKFWQALVPDPTQEDARSADAIERPLGAYYRVNHRDLVAMHAAISEVGVLFATGAVHRGWEGLAAGQDSIPYSEDIVGGHAFAIVGYDRVGFWVQNSWGEAWGVDGTARLTYDDWLINGSDVWVAALGAPVAIGKPQAGAAMRSAGQLRYASHVLADLRPHIITSKNDGVLDDSGDYGLTPSALNDLIGTTMAKKLAEWPKGKRRVLLYGHGGLTDQQSAVQTVANNLDPLIASQIYPLSFIWRSDLWNTIKDILQNAVRQRRDESFLDSAKDFMLDRIDDTLEPLARVLGGKALWDEMKHNAVAAGSGSQGATKLAVAALAALYKKGGIDEVHLVGFSAGAVLQGPIAKNLAAAGVPIESLSLWAPACTVDFFKDSYQPLLDKGAIKRFALYTMDDATERSDDCRHIYNKSLLYLVSAAFEAKPRIPLFQPNGTPILGLARDVTGQGIDKIFGKSGRVWNLSPGPASKALHHGDFDDDQTTRLSTLDFILGKQAVSKAAAAAALRTPIEAPSQLRRSRRHLEQAMMA